MSDRTYTFIIVTDENGITNFDVARKIMLIAKESIEELDPYVIARMVLAECEGKRAEE